MTKFEKMIVKVGALAAVVFAALYALAWILFEVPARRLEALFPGMPWDPRQEIWRTYFLLLWHDHLVQGMMMLGVFIALVFWAGHRHDRRFQEHWAAVNRRQEQYWQKYFEESFRIPH